jgi:molybdate transport system substrate-binding protein
MRSPSLSRIIAEIMSRPGRTRALFIAFLASIAVVIALVGWLWLGRDKAKPPLLMYCAVAVKTPVEAIAHDYERTHGVRIELQFGASQTLITNAAVSHKGDLYLPADDSYITVSRQRGLLGDELLLAKQRLALVVKKGNPKNIQTLDDLLRPDVKLAQAAPDAAASGKVTRDVLTKTGQWEPIRQHTAVFTGTVVEAANDVKLGAADAAFIWDAMATQYPELQVVPLDVLSHAESKLIVAVLKSSEQSAEAMRFAQYMASPETGLAQFKKSGFDIDVK